MSQAVAERMSQEPASEGTSLMAVISRAASDPNVDIDKMERLLLMQERIMARDAKNAFSAAFADMQTELPVIEERGHIIVREKAKDGSRTGDVIQDTSYALWEDINDAIKPVLSKFGFALTFKPGQTPDGRVTVTGILMHRDGHSEEATVTLQHDSSGSKNAVQAVGSSTSYGKRYAAGALLNLTSRDGAERDDDGKKAVEIMPKAKARPVDGEMRAEVNACSTIEELERLWKSKPFQQEFEKLPLDWQKMMRQHVNEHKTYLTERPTGAPPKGYVAPDFDKVGA
jgi:hypothetical protein